MNKREVVSFDDIELYYAKCRKIKFSNEQGEPSDINDIFLRFIGDKERTVFVREGHQCKSGRLRSLDDFIRICKYYLDTSVIDILRYIEGYYRSKEKGGGINFRGIERNAEAYYFGYCNNIRKNNFHEATSYWNIQYFYNATFLRNGFISYEGDRMGKLLN